MSTSTEPEFNWKQKPVHETWECRVSSRLSYTAIRDDKNPQLPWRLEWNGKLTSIELRLASFRDCQRYAELHAQSAVL